MDVDDLTDALTAHTPDQEAVLAALRTKRRRRARRRVFAAGGTAVAAAGAIILWTTGSGAPATTPAVGGGASGCAVTPLRQQLADAREEGYSVVLAKGALTGRTTHGDGPVYAEMRLTDVRTLSGPRTHPGSTAWVPSDHSTGGPVPGAPTGSLWAPDGSLFGIIAPRSGTDDPPGSLLRVAPVVQGQLVLSTAGCWLQDGRPTRPYPGPLAEIPGSDSFKRAAQTGFQTAPLSEVEHPAPR